MGRSVSTPSNVALVAYQSHEMEEEYEWDDFIDYIKESMHDIVPSFEECDRWIDREDHAIMENNLCYAGVSEYCGIIAIWTLHKNEHYGCDEEYVEQFAPAFTKRIREKFHERFGQIVKVGTFSDGTSVYENRKAA